MDYLPYRSRIYSAMAEANAFLVCAEISLAPSSLGQQIEHSIATTIPEIKAAFWQELYLRTANSDDNSAKVAIELSLGRDRVSYALFIPKDEPNPSEKIMFELMRFEVTLRAWLYSHAVNSKDFKEIDVVAGDEHEGGTRP